MRDLIILLSSGPSLRLLDSSVRADPFCGRRGRYCQAAPNPESVPAAVTQSTLFRSPCYRFVCSPALPLPPDSFSTHTGDLPPNSGTGARVGWFMFNSGLGASRFLIGRIVGCTESDNNSGRSVQTINPFEPQQYRDSARRRRWACQRRLSARIHVQKRFGAAVNRFKKLNKRRSILRFGQDIVTIRPPNPSVRHIFEHCRWRRRCPAVQVRRTGEDRDQ